jgi:membrane protein DedA with SNARE-associated domain/membrane-associated phospholipid phosphatase
MSDKISPILQWLNIHPNLAGLFIFIISAAESIAIIGTIIPGTIAMTAIGTLVGAGVIPLWSTFLWAIIGAVVGDNISYWTGHHFKDNLRKVWPFSTRPQWLNSGEKFFNRYGTMSVIIGRFIGPTRAIVPVVAGMLQMPPLRFILTSLAASIGWAPIYMLPGIVIGQATLELPPDMAANMMLRLILTGLFILFCIWIILKLFILVRDKINTALSHVWDKLEESRYFSIITTTLRHHDDKNTHGQIILAFYLLLSALAFSYLAFYLSDHAPATIVINNAVFNIFRSLRTSNADDVMIFITMLGDKKILVPVISIVLAWLAYKKHWRTFCHGVALFGLTAVSITSFKHIVHVIRPWGITTSPESFSFPSGHSTLATSFYVGLSLLLFQSKPIRCKCPVILATIIVIGAVSVSRLYLGAHWFTDVVGGWLLSATILMGIVLSYNRNREKEYSVKGIIIAALLLVIIGASAVSYHSHDKLKYGYSQLDWPSYNVKVNDWWNQDKNSNLPLYRIGRIGIPVEVLNLQWVGNLDDIKKILLSQGWQEPSSPGWSDILPRLSDVTSAEHLPLVSPLYLDKKPVLVLIKNLNGNKKPIVLRLWDSNIRIQGTSKELWVGSVGIVPRTYSWIITYKHNEFELKPAVIFNELPADYVIKQLTVLTNLKHKLRLQSMLLIKPKELS